MISTKEIKSRTCLGSDEPFLALSSSLHREKTTLNTNDILETNRGSTKEIKRDERCTPAACAATTDVSSNMSRGQSRDRSSECRAVNFVAIGMLETFERS